MQDPSTYDDIYSPTAKMTAFRILMAKAAEQKWPLYSDDASQAFLNSLRPADKPIYCKYPPGIDHKPGTCIRCNRFIYGLHDSPLAWFRTLKEHLVSEQGFTQSKTDQALFVKVEGKEEVYVNVHVDDFLSTGTPKLLADYRRRLYAKFKMTGGLVERHYGLNIRRGKLGEVFVDCQDYILDKCKELNIAPGKFNTPMAADLVLAAAAASSPRFALSATQVANIDSLKEIRSCSASQ